MERPRCERCGTTAPGGVASGLKTFGYNSGEVKLLCAPCAVVLQDSDAKGRILPDSPLFREAPALLRRAAALVLAYRSAGASGKMPRAVEELRRAATACGLPRNWSRDAHGRLEDEPAPAGEAQAPTP